MFIIGAGSRPAFAAAQVAKQRQAGMIGRGMGHGQRHAQDGVGPQVLLVFGAVEFDHPLVDGCV